MVDLPAQLTKKMTQSTRSRVTAATTHTWATIVALMYKAKVLLELQHLDVEVTMVTIEVSKITYLFQIPLSQVYQLNSNTISLLLYVRLVKQEYLLNLNQYLPFPFTLNVSPTTH